MHFRGHFFENKKVVQKIGSGRIKGDVGCDRMVFAINSDIFSMNFDLFLNKWSLDQGKKTINPLIPYEFLLFSLGIGGTGRKAFQIYRERHTWVVSRTP